MKAVKEVSAGIVGLGLMAFGVGGAAIAAVALWIAVVCTSVGLAGCAWQFMWAHI